MAALDAGSTGAGVAEVGGGYPAHGVRETVDSAEHDPDATSIEAPAGVPSHRNVAQGEQIGRYTVLELLGSGGMGVVYRVRDPELDREIALKLLLLGGRSGGDTRGRRARLTREAQLLAQLSHPNIVAVYDVGTVGGDPYIAMELVRGRTLRKWLESTPTWRQILDMFIATGRGVAAAHARGIVHRDFKLENVLVGDDGRPRVLDFGLARPVEGSEMLTKETTAEGSVSAVMPADLTRDGTVMGTPRTMSPEQHRGAPADERSDQYSFCLGMFEALFGMPPFSGEDLRALARRKYAGEMVPIPRDSPVPPRVRKAVLRGLSTQRVARWESMDALLAELEAAVRPPRKWPWVLGLGLAGLAGAWLATRQPEAATCTGERQAAQAWNDEIKARGRIAFEDSELGFAAQSWQRTERLVDDYLARWTAAYVTACEAAQAAGDDAALADRGLTCLQTRLSELGGLTEAFAQADRDVVQHAVTAVLGLSSPADCMSERLGSAKPAPPTEVAGEVERERSRLREAATLAATGKYADALVVAEAVADAARGIGFAPLSAEASLVCGRLHAQLGTLEPAEASLSAAYLQATEAGDETVALDAATALVRVVGAGLARPEDGDRWFRHAEALLSRRGEAPRTVATLTANVGVVLRHQGKYEAALGRQEAALALRIEHLGPDHPSVAESHKLVGEVLHDLGRFDAALEHLQEALALRRRTLGPDHPEVAESLAALGYELYIIGRAAEALEVQKQALALRRSGLGSQHPAVAHSLSNAGRSYALLGQLEESIAAETEALEIRTRVFGEESPEVATSLSSLGITLHNAKRFEDALSHQRRALAIRERVLGPKHPHTAMVRINMGFDYEAMQRWAEARDQHLAAATIVREAYGEKHLLLTYALNGLGNAQLGLGNVDLALAALREAVAVAEALQSDFLALAQARFGLARALWDQAKDRDLALAQAREARRALAEAGKPAAPVLEAIDTWLASIGHGADEPGRE